VTQAVAILGAGSWGTALAVHLSRCGHDARLWGRNKDAQATLATDRVNHRYLPDLVLPETLKVTASLKDALQDATTIVVAVPSSSLEATLTAIEPCLAASNVRASENVSLVWACKGFADTRLLHEIVYEKFDDICVPAVLSGPSFAAELAKGLPTATTIASTTLPLAQRIASVFHGESFRAYASDDMIGVQLGGALKNIYAIATGVSDGLGFGANTRAALITRGMAEIMRLALPLGGRAETLGGLSGMGDLVLTCTDDQSRNRRFGLALGRGSTPADALDSIDQVVEGASAVVSAIKLSRLHDVELPIANQVHALIHEGRSAEQAVAQILSRAPTSEF